MLLFSAHLHDVTGRVVDSDALPLATAAAGLLVDRVHNLQSVSQF